MKLNPRTVVAGLTLILFGILVFFFSSSPIAEPKLAVTFLSTTNNNAGAHDSVFFVSNACPLPLFRISSYRITGPSGLDRDTLKNQSLGGEYVDRILRPGDSEIIRIPTPIAVDSWRARFDFFVYRGPIGSVVERWMITVGHALGCNVAKIRKWHTGISEVIHEPSVNRPQVHQ